MEEFNLVHIRESQAKGNLYSEHCSELFILCCDFIIVCLACVALSLSSSESSFLFRSYSSV